METAHHPRRPPSYLSRDTSLDDTWVIAPRYRTAPAAPVGPLAAPATGRAAAPRTANGIPVRFPLSPAAERRTARRAFAAGRRAEQVRRRTRTARWTGVAGLLLVVAGVALYLAELSHGGPLLDRQAFYGLGQVLPAIPMVFGVPLLVVSTRLTNTTGRHAG